MRRYPWVAIVKVAGDRVLDRGGALAWNRDALIRDVPGGVALIGTRIFRALGWHNLQGHDWRRRPCRSMQGTVTAGGLLQGGLLAREHSRGRRIQDRRDGEAGDEGGAFT